MVDFNGLVNKVKRAVGENSDTVRSGLDKVEQTINQRTGDKYADKLSKGRGGFESAIGVPKDAKDAYTDEANAPQQRPDGVGTEPVDRPRPVDDPRPLDEQGPLDEQRPDHGAPRHSGEDGTVR